MHIASLLSWMKSFWKIERFFELPRWVDHWKIPNLFNKVWLENSVSPISSNDVTGQLCLQRSFRVKCDNPTHNDGFWYQISWVHLVLWTRNRTRILCSWWNILFGKKFLSVWTQQTLIFFSKHIQFVFFVLMYIPAQRLPKLNPIPNH